MKGLMLVVVLSVAAWGQAILPLAEVRPGMTGYGLTVVAGTDIARFDVEVVAVLDEPGDKNDFIVVRVWGEAITRSGGVAQGMSGSPIYIEDKLVGALSRAAMWSMDRERPLALVTPIEPMLKVLEEVTRSGPSWDSEERFGVLGMDPWPVAVPLMVSGLSARAQKVLEQGVRWDALDPHLASLFPLFRLEVPGVLELGIPRVIAAPGLSTSWPTVPLQPGAPVGVALATGDVSIGALGTVTLVRDGALLAFGHPFLFTGACRYFLTDAAVLDTVAAYDISYKFGTLGEIQGGIFADRLAGIAGRIGRIPRGIATKISVQDLDTVSMRTLAVRLVEEPRLSPLLLFVSGIQAADEVLDRLGQGTATVRYTIRGLGMPRPLTRENVFLSTEDIALYAAWEAALVMDVLMYNEFQDPRLTSVDLEVAVRTEFRAAEVVELITEKGAYAPGDVVRFLVRVRNWRGQEEEWEGELKIPEELDSPYVELRAYGGPRRREKGEPPPILESLGDLIDYLEGLPPYDTLTVELFARDPISDLVGETWLYGVKGISDRLPGVVVYGRVSVILPLERK